MCRCRPFTVPVNGQQCKKLTVVIRYWSDEIQLDFFVRTVHRGYAIFFSAGYVRFYTLTGKFAGDAGLAFLLNCVGHLLPPGMPSCQSHLVDGWMSSCRRLITVVRKFFGTIILSSMKTRPNRLDSFLLCIWYSSGIISCCCLSMHTRVFSRLGSFVVSFTSNCRSVEKFFSVSRTACSKFQSFCSSAAIRGACPIFTYWTLFTPTYSANLSLVLLGPRGRGPFPSRFHPLPW